MRNVLALVSGALFAVGLALSGMTQPSKVIGFLDVAGRWDPSLAFVMAGAVSVYFIAYHVSLARSRSTLRFPERPLSDIDGRLVVGAAVFGVGWGMGGFCPGPALVSVGAGTHGALWFVPAMVAGILLQRRWDRRPKQTFDCQ